MKVLELCLSTGVGGLEHYAIRTAKQLLEHGLKCIAIVAKDTMTESRMKELGVKTIILNRSSKIFPIIAAKKLAKIIDVNKIDIIHLHWSNDFNLAVFAKRYSSRPVKLIYTRQMMLTRPKHDFYHRFLYRHVDLLLTITNELCNKARHFLPMPGEKIQTLYYGVQKPPLLSVEQHNDNKKAFNISGNNFSIGMIGRIEPGKGQYLLINAVEQLSKQGHNVHVTLIGPAMKNDYLRSLKKKVVEKGLDSIVTFYGSHKNPIEVMSVFDVVVLATVQETFGLVLIEAMRNGVAVIGTNAGGVPEIIDDMETGLLFEPENTSSLVQALLQLIEDVEFREKLAQAGKSKAEQKFTQERHYDQLLKHMGDLLSV